MAERRCPACGEEMEAGARECPWCGAPLKQTEPALTSGAEAPRPAEAGPQAGPDCPAGEAPAEPGKAVARTKKRRRWPIAVAVCALVAVIVGMVTLSLRRGETSGEGAYEVNHELECHFADFSEWTYDFESGEREPVRVEPPIFISRDGQTVLDGEDENAYWLPADRSDDGSRRLVAAYDLGVDRADAFYFYDRGRVTRHDWTSAAISGDGAVVAYTQAAPEGGNVLRRWDVASDQTRELGRGAVLVTGAGLDGSVITCKASGEGDSDETCFIWTERRGLQPAPEGVADVKALSAQGGAFVSRYGYDISNSVALAWPDETGALAVGSWDVEMIAAYDRALTQVIYCSEGAWWYETAQGATPLDMPGKVTALGPLRPQRAGQEGDRVLDWVYHFWLEEGGSGLLYIAPDLTVEVLVQTEGTCDDCLIDPDGERVLFRMDGAVFRIDRPRSRRREAARLCETEDRKGGILADVELEHCYYRDGGNKLYYLPGDGSMELVDTALGNVGVMRDSVLPGGGCWYMDETGVLCFAKPGEAPRTTGVTCQEFYEVGSGEALALRELDDGSRTLWRLSPDGTATQLPSVSWNETGGEG